MIGWGAVAGLVSGVLDKLIPDANKRQEVKLKLAELADKGEFRELETRFEAIVMEAKSADPWTSRARPSFLYVMYIMIMASIPFGFLFAFAPELAREVVTGSEYWFKSIPPELYTLFGAGYLGYTVNRSQDKARLLGQDAKPGFFSKIFG